MPRRSLKGFPAHKRLPDLLPEEIQTRAAEIRAEWDEETELSRRTGRYNKRIETTLPGEQRYAIPPTHTTVQGLTNLRDLEANGTIEKSTDPFDSRNRTARIESARKKRQLEEDDE